MNGQPDELASTWYHLVGTNKSSGEEEPLPVSQEMIRKVNYAKKLIQASLSHFLVALNILLSRRLMRHKKKKTLNIVIDGGKYIKKHKCTT